MSIRIEGASVVELDTIQTALSVLVCHIETGTTYLRANDIHRMGSKVAAELKVSVRDMDETQSAVVASLDRMRADVLQQKRDMLDGSHRTGPVDRKRSTGAFVNDDPIV